MDNSERWKSIAPVSHVPGQQRHTPDMKKRRRAVGVACIPCRNGKSKCDGIRPVCTRCKENNLYCQFDVPEGVSRAERMKIMRRETLTGRAEELERIIIALRTESDVQASTLLARLRLGERVEDIAASLPTTLNATVFGAPSLVTHDSTGTSASGVSAESFASEESSSRQHSSSTSLTVPTGTRPNWPLASTIATSPLSSSAKGKQPMRAEAEGRPFLSLIFNRDDVLLVVSDSEDEDDTDGEMEELVVPSWAGSTSFVSFSRDVSGNADVSSRKNRFQKSIHVTHLVDRQPIVSILRIHPNLDLRSHFGNLPFSSSIPANHNPLDVQGVQMENLFLPTWAMMTINTRPDPGSLRNAFSEVLEQSTEMIQNGTPLNIVIETHPNIAALFDEKEFNMSGILSKWSASVVHSAMLTGNNFTCFACMYCAWYLMRWMISPSPETYQAVPEWLRPTPNQLFMPHIKVVDFIIWPAFRELVVQIPAMQQRMEWLMEYNTTIRCDWSFPVEEALCRHEKTGLWDLCDMAKACLHDLSNWSLGPSFRGYVSNADSYVRIRTENV